MAEERDEEVVEHVVKALVDHPDDVKTDREVDEMGVLISLHLNAEDMGQVIGRSGQTAKAIRTLLRVVGAKNQARVNLKIVEPEGSDRGHSDRGHSDRGRAPSPAPAPAEDAPDAMEDFKL